MAGTEPDLPRSPAARRQSRLAYRVLWGTGTAVDDPARVADTKAWLGRAAVDLRAAAIDLASEPPLLEDLVFHCQQAVERAMKGLLAWHDEPFGKTQNLEALGETFEASLARLPEGVRP